jgi:protein phosphatase
MDDGSLFPKLRAVLDLFIHVIKTVPPSEYGRSKPKIQIPILASDLFIPMLSAATDLFRAEPILLQIEPPVNVIGDLHGSLFDLMRFLNEFGLPPDQSYLFLGDLIDRGSFSTETIVLVLLLKIAYPDKIWVIRGNHEFDERFVPHTDLVIEMVGLYASRVFMDPFFEMFAWMPLAADIGHYAFAVHGGISPSLFTLGQIEEIQRPITSFAPKLVEDLLWSDPCERCSDSMPSTRGLGVMFGINIVRRFMAMTGFQIMIRGHESVPSGIKVSLSYRVVTVFSASNYCGDEDTHAGLIQVFPDPSYEKRVLSPLPKIERHNVRLISSEVFKVKSTLQKPGSARGIRPVADSTWETLGNTRRSASARRMISKRPEPGSPQRQRVPRLPSPRRSAAPG